MSYPAIEQLATFRPHINRPSANTRSRARATEQPADLKHVVILTGANTTLGAHLFHRLRTKCPNVKMIYYILQAQEFSDGIVRGASEIIHRAQREHNLSFDYPWIEAFWVNMAEKNLGLEDEVYATLREKATTIIDAAAIGAFYDAINHGEIKDGEELAGMHNLIQLSLDVPSASPALLFQLTPSVVGYETADGVRENETYPSATARALAVPARTLDKTQDLLIAAAETDKAKTYTVWMPKDEKLPTSEKSAKRTAAVVLDYILDDARWGEDGSRQTFIENKDNDTQ